jgi:dTDP-3-amino-3,4,6-trideoxy-alpha-D-glucose transaminase
VSGASLPFLELRLGEDAEAVRAAVDRVVASGWYVLGPEVEAFEREFADACGAREAVAVGTGTDALALALRALAIGPGDEVIVPAMTAAYTALAVMMAGATPVIADVSSDRLTLDPDACDAAVTDRTRALIPVHLYGQAADLAALRRIAARRGLAIVEDCCQAHLATCDGVPVGTTSEAGAFSFYPTKNLGALGDGGAIITNDPDRAALLRCLRNGGQTTRYHHGRAGVNSRLDELQAAVLRARLPFLGAWTDRRRALAGMYRQSLASTAVMPVPELDAGHVYHLFAIRTPRRDLLQARLREEGIETLIHYPVALSQQPAFAACPAGPCPVAERSAAELLSLPLNPLMSDAAVGRVADAVRRGAVEGR